MKYYSFLDKCEIVIIITVGTVLKKICKNYAYDTIARQYRNKMKIVKIQLNFLKKIATVSEKK